MLVSPSSSHLSAVTHRLTVHVCSNPEAQDFEIVTLSYPTDSSTFSVLETLDTNTTFSEFIVDFSTYTDEGATATDDEEGDVSANIVVGGDTVDTSTDGTYTITYDVSDGAGNAATTVSRVVTVETPAYCDSEPTSNDGSGISSVAFNGTDFTSGGDITYEDFTATAVEAGQSPTASLNITFATGYTSDTHVWVELTDDYSFD